MSVSSVAVHIVRRFHSEQCPSVSLLSVGFSSVKSVLLVSVGFIKCPSDSFVSVSPVFVGFSTIRVVVCVRLFHWWPFVLSVGFIGVCLF